jgi:Rps23 Pro-64 3,4-dihydroxylase Tpa1-like proline 4-hydroxylase
MNQTDLVTLMVNRIESSKLVIQKHWFDCSTGTKYFILEDFLPSDIAMEVFNAFPRDRETFLKRKSFREQKSTLADLDAQPKILSDITNAFQEQEVIQAISDVVNMRALESDPSLYAGGLSMMFNHDFLKPHIDNSHDGSRSRYRRLNLLYYVSPNWTLENGANFELWDSKVQNNNTLISKFNRLIVMETNSKSWHSVSQSKVEQARCCISSYYFSKESPSGSDYFHVTSFMGRPGETGKRLRHLIDNFLRQTVSKYTGIGRGKSKVRKV